MKSTAITVVFALTLLAGCSLSPVIPKNQWRQPAVSASDTVFPGIKIGMTERQVRALVPAAYGVMDDQTNILRESPDLRQLQKNNGHQTKFLRLNRLHPDERVFEIDYFVFVDGHLTEAFGGYSSPLE